MSIAPLIQDEISPTGIIVDNSWVLEHSSPVHEFAAIACPEEEGGYSIFATDYPEVISQGDTLDEARLNIAEAFVAMLEAKRKHGESLLYSRDVMIDVAAGYTRLRIRIDG